MSTSSITDRNGNVITVTGYFDVNGIRTSEIDIADQANRRVKVAYPGPPDIVTREYCPGTTQCAPDAVTWQTNQTWTVSWQAYTAGYFLQWPCGENWTLSTACNYIPSGTFVSSIALPQAAITYQFHYNLEPGSTGGWGELRSVQTPLGYLATYSYLYDNARRSGTWPVTWNPVTTKVGSYPDTHPSETWTYASCAPGSSCVESDVTAPDGGTTKTSYLDLGRNVPWKTEEPNGDLVKRLWLSNLAPNPSTSGALPNAYVKTEYRFIKSSGVLKAAEVKDYSYDKNGNLLSMDEYDCLPAACSGISTDPASAPTVLPTGLPLARHTEYTYAASTPDASTAPISNQSYAYWNWTSPGLLNAKKSLKVTGTGPPRYSEFTYDAETGRGNLLQELNYDSTKATFPSGPPPLLIQGTNGNAIRPFGAANYDANGNLLSRQDANNTPTTYAYGTGSCMNSYPTSVTVSSGTEALTTNMTWDCTSGQMLTSTDPNQLMTTRTHDVMDRVLTVTESNGNTRLTTITYNDVARTVTTVAPFDPQTSRTLTTTDTYDARGRLILSKAPNASCTQATVERRYLTPQGGGFSYELVSNPYCATSDPTMGWTRTKRDQNGRVTEVATYPTATAPAPWDNNSSPSGVSTTDYSLGDQVDSTDPAGKKRRTRVDGLGRMVQAIEDPDVSAYSTTYAYDLRDGLTSVTQTRKASGATDIVQNRTFTYDSLGRLGSANNLESGTTSYTYYETGTVHTTALANGPTRTFTYNTRNQITSKTYSATDPVTPQVFYCYDGKIALTNGTGCATSATAPFAAGKLTGVGSSASVTNYTAYDYLGRIVNSEQWVDGHQYAFTYAYLAGGQLSYEIYPSGTKVNYAYNNAGQPITVGKGNTMPACPSPTCYAANIAYAPQGAIQSGTFGPLLQTIVYNSRLQLTDLTATKSGATMWSMHNDYGAAQNNGNLLNQTVDATGAGGVSVSASIGTTGYDALNRLVSNGESSNRFPQTYGYDSVGNRWVTNGNVLAGSFTPVTKDWFDGATNRLTSVGAQMQYEAPGNLTGMGGYVLAYDAEGRQSKATIGTSTTQYWYDGDGHRVKKQTGTLTPTVYVYDANGELVAEYGGAGTVTMTQYPLQDHLGSTRMVVDGAGELPGAARLSAVRGGGYPGSGRQDRDDVPVRRAGRGDGEVHGEGAGRGVGEFGDAGPRLLRRSVLLGGTGQVHQPGPAVQRPRPNESAVVELVQLRHEQPSAVYRPGWAGSY